MQLRHPRFLLWFLYDGIYSATIKEKIQSMKKDNLCTVCGSAGGKPRKEKVCAGEAIILGELSSQGVRISAVGRRLLLWTFPT